MKETMQSLNELQEKALESVKAANDMVALEEQRVAYLGKKGLITGQMKNIATLPSEQRKDFGQAVNAVKQAVTDAIEARKTVLKRAEMDARLQNETVDISLPVRESDTQGAVHPITQTIEEMVAIFAEQGFNVATGPSLEDDFHNFTALNFPPNHPARTMHDTFYITPENENDTPNVLRTHTSTVQVRYMKEHQPPVKMICHGRVYRSDYDQTHTPMFHQIEGLMVDKTTHFGHLKGILQDFLSAFFEVDDLPVRFRPSFFPFTEPSAEVDIGCSWKNGELVIGGGDKWMEILGCGMVHPNVLKNVGYDPEKLQGFAFGMGVERLAMLKYGIPDLRTFFDADLRWLKHYGFAALQRPSRAMGE
jgi:phenylalanyl-tRNA synthetase alpha chain